MMEYSLPEIRAEGWICHSCRQPLRPVPVEITYMGASFKVELPGCPDCGLTLIPPELAEGKMLEVEKLLEDK